MVERKKADSDMTALWTSKRSGAGLCAERVASSSGTSKSLARWMSDVCRLTSQCVRDSMKPGTSALMLMLLLSSLSLEEAGSLSRNFKVLIPQ